MDKRALRVKKAMKSAPVSRLTAEERAKQYSIDFYTDDAVLFCRFCEHSVDFTRLDTVKDHIKSKRHSSRKSEWKEGASSSSKQTTLRTCIKSKDLREEFALDYLKMCTIFH